MSLVADLHRLLPSPCCDRPFVCDGRPDSCDVIVIGQNSATKMNTDWWSFWDDETGFNLGKFEKAHEQVRHAQRRGARLRLKYLRDKKVQCLETNVFMNEGLGGHKAGSKVSCNPVLPILLIGLSPLKGVIAHGSVAQEYLRKFPLPSSIPKYYMRPFRTESYNNLDVVIEKMVAG